ncbi:hypothetical protein F5148DRAFT_194916 [Russula earlei]|uniref:Uncharacterized protein n=1 Tax=Russula earlei TaxID=71964 RepID=A0ACC0U501_9AGAM|nr:hypothetical protein F5148DRAFT_194916 [Russula earlei]
MPLRRILNTFVRASARRPFDEDVTMTDATLSSVNSLASPPPLASFPSVKGFTLLGKRRYEESSGHDAQPTSPSSSPDASHRNASLSSPNSADPSTPATRPLKRPNLALDYIETDLENNPRPSSSHGQEPVSPTPTEIALDLGDAPQTPEECIEGLRAAGIKVRDFAYEPMPNSCKAPEVFDPVPSLIAADWHMRNPRENHGLLTAKGLFRLIKIGWLSLADIRKHVHPRAYTAVAQYNERPDEQRYPFVVPQNATMPTPSQRVRMRRKAGLRTHPDDLPDGDFFRLRSHGPFGRRGCCTSLYSRGGFDSGRCVGDRDRDLRAVGGERAQGKAKKGEGCGEDAEARETVTKEGFAARVIVLCFRIGPSETFP